MSYTLYKVVCAANGKVYVGYTSKTAEERFAMHLQNARWKRQTVLYNAMRHYGPDAFSVSEILRCETHAEACEHERRLIAELASLLPCGYNMTHGGDGVPLTPEQREAANTKKRGRCTAKQRAASQRRKGSKASAETRKLLSDARKGAKQKPEHVQKRTEAFRRNRAAKLGIPYTDAPLRAPKGSLSGKRVWTEETRRAERERALSQWTPEAKQAARERAARQWTPEARQAASERRKAILAEKRAMK